MPGRKHTHLYGRRPIYTSHTVWACHLPDCSHYQPIGTQDAVLEGKLSRCWQCSKEFRLTRQSLENDRPCCSEKCMNEFQLVETLQYAQSPSADFGVKQDEDTMCEKCKIRLRSGNAKWCIECFMRS